MSTHSKLHLITLDAAGNQKLRFVTVEYAANGQSTVTPRTAWLSPSEAAEIVCAS